MKKSLILLLISFLSLSTTLAGEPVDPVDLPDVVSRFLDLHFPGVHIEKAEKGYGRFGAEYDIDLATGAEIDILENGDWTEVKAAPDKAVPAAIVPPKIAEYVTKDFAGHKIIGISRKKGGYKLELWNGTELRLSEDAEPLY